MRNGVPTVQHRPGVTPGTRGVRGRGGAVLLLALLFVTSGCASWALQGNSPSSRALEETPPELDFLVGRDLEMEGRLQEALDAYTRALSKDPESVYLLKRSCHELFISALKIAI